MHLQNQSQYLAESVRRRSSIQLKLISPSVTIPALGYLPNGSKRSSLKHGLSRERTQTIRRQTMAVPDSGLRPLGFEARPLQTANADNSDSKQGRPRERTQTIRIQSTAFPESGNRPLGFEARPFQTAYSDRSDSKHDRSR